MESLIKVSHLTKAYNDIRGIFDVSFEVKKGETLGFLGPNGAGKTTTMRHLMGFSKPDSGTCKICGIDTINSDEAKSHIGYIPGEISLPDGLKGYEFIEMMQGLCKKEDKDKVNFLLDLFNIDTTANVKKMSIGEKRKLAIIVAFMNDPEVLLLDEPTSGLDPHAQEIFIEFIKGEKKRGKTILLSSHIFSEVDQLCDRIAIIKDGRIVSVISNEDIKKGLRKIFNIEFENSKDIEEFKECGYEVIDENDNQISILIDDSEINNFISIISKYKIKSYTQNITTLEDYFMNFYKSNKDYSLR